MNKIYKKCCDKDHTQISFRGQFKLESHPALVSFRGLILIPTSIPFFFTWDSPTSDMKNLMNPATPRVQNGILHYSVVL